MILWESEKYSSNGPTTWPSELGSRPIPEIISRQKTVVLSLFDSDVDSSAVLYVRCEISDANGFVGVWRVGLTDDEQNLQQQQPRWPASPTHLHQLTTSEMFAVILRLAAVRAEVAWLQYCLRYAIVLIRNGECCEAFTHYLNLISAIQRPSLHLYMAWT